MANPTSNFNWQMPTASDLVTDLPADFEVFGQAVDTSLADLKGGTTGQVLSKASNTNMDFTWTAIDPLVILDAKGDLITATAADTPARLAVGTNDQVLTVDSTTSTGLKWANAQTAYTLLASGNFSTGSATLALTSIPATYEELYLVLRDVAPSTAGQLQLRFNNDSGASYLALTTTTSAANNAVSATEITMSRGNNVYATGINNLWVIRVPDYANSNAFKLLTNTFIFQDDPATYTVANVAGFYRSTTAISQINFLNSSASNWAAGSYELFGVK